jgi:TolB-like protein
VVDPEAVAPQQRASKESARPSPKPAAQEAPASAWGRIKRHKVVEWTLAYVAFGYALLHTVEMLGEAFEWPLLVPRLTVFGLVLGAPIAVTLAWYHGHRARQRVSGPELSILIVLLMIAGSVMWWLPRISHEHYVASAPALVGNTAVSATSATGSFNPPPHSIAVLPFVNMSGDKDQEYFSDGLTEELLNSLSRIDALQVAARTSAFSFKGKDTDIGTIARKLNVGTVLEGSVRRSGHTIRVTTQLINAVTGFHLSSETYDRDLGDVLKLQTEIAATVTSALKVTLLGDMAAKIEMGGTRNPAALDAYLKATNAHFTWRDPKRDELSAIAAYSEAVRLDPNYALAFAGRSIAFSDYAQWITGRALHDALDNAQIDARRAIALAPQLAEGHLALASLSQRSLNFAQASTEFERALELAPGNARVLRNYGWFAVCMGRTDAGMMAARRAAVLDPLNPSGRELLGYTMSNARRPDEALTAFQQLVALLPDSPNGYALRGIAHYTLGDLQSARSSCETKPDFSLSQLCLAMTYQKLGRHADAQATLAKAQAENGEALAYSYVWVYAQWGSVGKALDWLETAYRVGDSDLEQLKTDPLVDPLRREPRYQAIERALKFPD